MSNYKDYKLIDKLVFLYSFNRGELDLPFSPNHVPFSSAVNFLLEDSYVYLLRQLVDAGLVKKVYVVSKCREDSHRFAGFGIYKESESLEIVYPPNLDSFESYVGKIDEDDIIWTRGTSELWTNFLSRHIQSRKVLYNLAYLRADPRIYDLVFVDEDCQFQKLKKHLHSYTFIKPCNENVFYPIDVPKIYDIISIGIIRERKGQLKVVRAAKKLKRPLKLIFPGALRDEIYKKRCINAAKGSDLTLEFPGIVKRSELNLLINRSRLHILASHYEQAPRALLEVACAGLPSLITNRIGGGKNYITPKTGGICRQWQLAASMKKALDCWTKPVREGYLEKFSARHALEKVTNAFKEMDWI